MTMKYKSSDRSDRGQVDSSSVMNRLIHVIIIANVVAVSGFIPTASTILVSCRRVSGRHHRCPRRQYNLTAAQADTPAVSMEKALFVEVGFGNDQHGQDPTKACVRACRNAIEFNSIPSINSIVPGGYASMKLRVQLAVPVPEEQVDVEQIKKVFPYGQLLPVEFQQGGMRASSGIELPEMGDRGDDMIIAVSCVTVGY